MTKISKWTEYAVEGRYANDVWLDEIHFQTEKEALEYVASENTKCGGEFYRYAGPIQKEKKVKVEEFDWIANEWKWDKYHRAFE